MIRDQTSLSLLLSYQTISYYEVIQICKIHVYAGRVAVISSKSNLLMLCDGRPASEVRMPGKSREIEDWSFGCCCFRGADNCPC